MTRTNLFTSRGPNLDAISSEWRKVFGKSIPLPTIPSDLSTRDTLDIVTKHGVIQLRLKRALALGKEGVLLRAQGFKTSKSLGIVARGKDAIRKKFPKVRVLKHRLDNGKVQFLCTYLDHTAWVSLYKARNVTHAGSLFDSTFGQKLKKERGLAAKTATAIRKAEAKLASWGLSDLWQVSRLVDDHLIFIHISSKFELPVARLAFVNDTPDRRTFIARALAWKRYESSTPLRYTDKEWERKVLLASAGSVKPDGGYVPANKRKDGYRMICLDCDHHFSLLRVFNKAHTVIRCPECGTRQSKNYSKSAVAWLTDLATRFKLKIQHAESPKGEYRLVIDGRSFHVDGYDAAHRLVFEYHGSRWHGNPLLFYPDEAPSPYSTKTALSLLTQTLRRELDIVNAGYNYVRIWDQDFLNHDRYSQWLLSNSKRILKAKATQP